MSLIQKDTEFQPDLDLILLPYPLQGLPAAVVYRTATFRMHFRFTSPTSMPNSSMPMAIRALYRKLMSL